MADEDIDVAVENIKAIPLAGINGVPLGAVLDSNGEKALRDILGDLWSDGLTEGYMDS